ncbi:hypothetical protein VA596_09650 [Amycolatopsis sp., V23-08]|uniref:WXG100 family type VII secretion target n=1 Tax=Amycolatopsis heterodermiae TaxID=3110235 RepID=A0ABU5R0U2_9PSEU|nr:hypothetical protein [Amycolatopsis sp., V23-08]MEA5359801.1 hypothetical protein [Amycolatopsis sp., V23-08]
MAEKSMLDQAKADTDSEKYVVDSALEGAGGLQDLVGGVEKMAHGDWTEGLFSLANAGFGIKDVIKDPFETLLSWGFGWLIEHVDFLKEPLDWVAGDQDALDLEGKKWETIGERVQKAAEELTAEVRKNCLDWRGKVADQYRVYVQEQLDAYAALSDAATQVASIIGICKTILDVVRTLIRDLITDTLAKIVKILMRYPPPAYPAALAAEGIPYAVQQGSEMVEETSKLARAFAKAREFLRTICDALAPIAQKVLGRLGQLPKAAGEAAGEMFEGFGKAAGQEALMKAFEQLATGPGQTAGESQHDRDETSIVPEDHSTNYPVDKVPRSGPVTADDGQPFSGRPGAQRISGSLE